MTPGFGCTHVHKSQKHGISRQKQFRIAKCRITQVEIVVKIKAYDIVRSKSVNMLICRGYDTKVQRGLKSWLWSA